MLKKLFKTMAVCALAAIMAMGTTACRRDGGGENEYADQIVKDGRPAMLVSLFNGGYGRVWLDKAILEYNQAHPENKYKLQVKANKDEFNTIYSFLKAGNFDSDIFVTGNYPYKLIKGGYVEDISSVWASDPDDNGTTIEDIMYNVEDYKRAYGDGQGGLYALPLTEGIQSFIYDHDLFLTYGLLFNESGDFISSKDEPLSKGKDGVAGTYDDGHPITEEQWQAMILKAKYVYGYAFTYSGAFQIYLNNLYYQVFAQVDGVEAFEMNYHYTGTYNFEEGTATDKDGKPVVGKTTITPENGYLLHNMRGKKKAVEFLGEYTASREKGGNPYVNVKTESGQYSQQDAQRHFIQWTAEGEAKRSAMLYDGDWWENESTLVFNELVANGYSEYEFRTRNYKFMTLPKFEGQVAKGNVYNIADNMFFAVTKQKDAEKKQICLDFLTWLYKDEYIQNFTVESGGMMPFDVALTAEQTAKLSPFTQSYLEIYKDRENNEFVNVTLAKNIYDTKKCDSFPWMEMITGNYVVNSMFYYNGKTAAEVLETMKDYTYNGWQDGLKGYNTYIATKTN